MSTVNVGNTTNNPVPVNVNAGLPAGANNIGSVNIAAINAGLSDTTAALSGMTALNAATQIALAGTTSISVLLSGSWSATITPEVSVDGGTTWLATQFFRPDTQAFVTTVTANGTYNITGTAGCSHARVRCSAFTSGTVTGSLRAVTQGPNVAYVMVAAALPAGSNIIGALSANQSVNMAQVGGSNVATAATGIMKVGLTDGTGNAITSTSNAIDVNIKSGGGSGFSVVDEAAWTAGTSSMVPAGGVFNDSAAALSSGQEGTFRSTTNRALHTNLRDASGNQLLGSKTSANSVPVVIASDQGAVSVSLGSNNSTMVGVVSSGGISTTAIAAAATNTVVKTGAGRLCRVLVTTAGTAALTFYDNATGGSTSGNILGYVPANAAAGSVYDFQFLASTGIQAPGGASTPAVSVGYI